MLNLNDVQNILKYKYKNQNVCTTYELSDFFNVSKETIKTIFKRNSRYFKDKTICISGDDLSYFKENNPKTNKKCNKSLLLWTKESLYIMSQFLCSEKAFELSANIKNPLSVYCYRQENDLKIMIIKIFSKHHTIKSQVIDGCYRYDFLIDDKIVIECDENNHRYYDKSKEEEREIYIKAKGYELLRYNTNTDDIFEFMGEISYKLENTDQ